MINRFWDPGHNGYSYIKAHDSTENEIWRRGAKSQNVRKSAMKSVLLELAA